MLQTAEYALFAWGSEQGSFARISTRSGRPGLDRQHSVPVSQQLFFRSSSPLGIPRLHRWMGRLLRGGQGVRVVGPEYPELVGEQFLERGSCPARLPAFPCELFRWRLPM